MTEQQKTLMIVETHRELFFGQSEQFISKYFNIKYSKLVDVDDSRESISPPRYERTPDLYIRSRL